MVVIEAYFPDAMYESDDNATREGYSQTLGTRAAAALPGVSAMRWKRGAAPPKPILIGAGAATDGCAVMPTCPQPLAAPAAQPNAPPSHPPPLPLGPELPTAAAPPPLLATPIATPLRCGRPKRSGLLVS